MSITTTIIIKTALLTLATVGATALVVEKVKVNKQRKVISEFITENAADINSSEVTSPEWVKNLTDKDIKTLYRLLFSKNSTEAFITAGKLLDYQGF